MFAFTVPDMTCGGCVGSVTRAVKAIDPTADVEADLGSHRVVVRSSKSDSGPFARAIADAGFTVQPG
jgi:copper chaperone